MAVKAAETSFQEREALRTALNQAALNSETHAHQKKKEEEKKMF